MSKVLIGRLSSLFAIVTLACLPTVNPASASATGGHQAITATGAFDVIGVSVVPGSTDAYAFGTPYGDGGSGVIVKHRHDGRWTDVPVADSNGFGSVSGIAAGSPTRAWVVGYNPPNPYLVELSHGSFHNVTLPISGGGTLNAVSASSGRNAWAVGQLQGTTPSPLVLHWNGSTWASVAVGSAHPKLVFQSVSTTSPHNVWVSGSVSHGKRKPATSYLFHWNGSTWTRRLQSTTVRLGQLAAEAPNRVWATDYVSATDSVGGELGLLGMHGKWSDQVTFRDASAVGWNGITVSGSTGYAVGSGVDADGAVPFIVHLSDGSWHLQTPVEPGVDSHLNGVSMSSETTVAVGNWFSGNDAEGHTTHDLAESPSRGQWRRIGAP